MLAACVAPTSYAFVFPPQWPAPTVEKSFDPQAINFDGISQMTIRLTSNAPSLIPITDVQFNDAYPTGMANAANIPGGVVANNTCNGTVTADPNGTSVQLIGGTIPASDSCEIVVNVTNTAFLPPGGVMTNHTGLVTSSNAAAGEDATAALSVSLGSLMQAPTVTMKLLPDTLRVGGQSVIEIAIENPNLLDITGAQFAMSYPAHIVNSNTGIGGSAVVLNTCTTPDHVHATPNQTSLSMGGGTIPGGGFCILGIEVGASSEGSAELHTGAVFSANAQPGTDATATMHVESGSLLPAFAISKAFSPTSVDVGGTSQMTISFVNNDPDNAVTGLQVGDVYPVGIDNAPSGALVRNTCGGIPSMRAGNPDFDLYLINGTIPAGGTCSLVVNVIGTDPSFPENWVYSPLSANALSPDGAVADMVVTSAALLDAPTTSTSFLPTTVAIGETSQMTITLENLANPFQIRGAQINDRYPDGIANAPADVVVSNTCGGTLTAEPNGDFLALATGTIPGLDSCSVVVNVVGKLAGQWVNQTGPIPSANAQTGASAIAGLDVAGGAALSPPTVSKTFTPSSVPLAAPAQMTITLTNNEPSKAITGVQFSDPYPGGMANAATGVVVAENTCGGTVTAPQGGVSMALADGTIPPGGFCDVVINVVAVAPGSWVNQTTPVTSTNAGSSGVGNALLDVVGAAPQTITFTSSVPNDAVVGGSYQVAATATSGLPVVLTVDAASAAVCTITGGSVSFIGAGTCTIDANQGGGMNNGTTYSPASQIQQSFPVASSGGSTQQTITFTSNAPATAAVGGPSYQAAATATSGLPVVLTIDGTSASVCTINAGTVDFIGAGTCTIDANQGGGFNNGTNYAAASQVQQSFAVAGAGGVVPQTITFLSNPPANAVVGGPAYQVAAAATSGLPVVLTIDVASATVCAINANTVSFIAAGTCTIDANQGGGVNNGTNYAAAPQVQQPFSIADAGGQTSQTIAFTSVAPANAVVGGPTYLATATATSNLPVTLTIDATSAGVCAINAGMVTFVGAGTCTIDANQGGGTNNGTNYAPAPPMQQAFAVGTGTGSGNHAPLAVGDAIEVAPGSPVDSLVGDSHVPSSVLDNDVNFDIDPPTAVKLTDPTHGALQQFHPDGTFVYQSGASTGTDSFTYKTCGASACSAPTTVTITIGTGLHGHAPFATDDAIAVASGGTTGALIGDVHATDSVLDNDIDPDGDALTAFKLSDPSHGTASIGPDGTFSYQNDGGDPATTDNFYYAGCDAGGACNAGVVTITIGTAGFANHAPVVVDDALQVAPGQSANALIGDPNVPGSVLDNDHDPDQSDMLTAVKMSALFNLSGDVLLNADGTLSYQNIDHQATTDTLIYEACDSYFTCTPGIVTISINNDPLDVAPVATDDALVVAPNGSTSLLLGGATSVLANDSDPGDMLTAHLISAPSNGHVTLNTDGTFTYHNDDPSAGVDSLEYEACDGEGACTGATVSVTIDGTAPTVTCTLPSQLNVVGDTVTVDLSQLFAPPPGQTLSYGATNAPPSLLVTGSLLTGTLQQSDVPSPPYMYGSTLTATAAGSGTSVSENVTFQVLPTGEILLRNGFDGQTVQQPCH
jgi:VCBS repeat-containing protein